LGMFKIHSRHTPDRIYTIWWAEIWGVEIAVVSCI
jgi:hypothetical protein